MKLILQRLVNEFPFSYFNMLKTTKFKKLFDFVMFETSFVDYVTPISSRCWYVLNNRHELVKCAYCGKILRKTFKPSLKQSKFWCDEKCSNSDPNIKKLIGSRNKISKSGKTAQFYVNKLPDECNVKMKNELIEYDEISNEKIVNLLSNHKRNFRNWICKNKQLHKYLLEKSYPLDFTKLNLETRVYWIAHQMQEIPRCKTCGRQLDFKNVKMSSVWPQYCSLKCQYDNKELKNLTCLRNARKFYNKYFKNSTMIVPLFSIEEFAANRHNDEHLYKCKCKKCQNEFSSKFDMNFFMREGQKQTAFKCLKCFPQLSHRQSHAEIELDEFVESIVGKENVLRGTRKAIWPYELDCYVPKLKIAFEFNGIYWHSHEKLNDINAHLFKTKLCEKNNIKLVYVWEDQWRKNKHEIENLIKGILTDENFISKFYNIDDNTKNIIVDRSIFNKCFKIPDFKLLKATRPKLKNKKHISTNKTFQIADCGYLKYVHV